MEGHESGPDRVVASIDKVSVTASPTGVVGLDLMDWLSDMWVAEELVESYRRYPVAGYGMTCRLGGMLVQAEPVGPGRVRRPYYRLCWNPQSVDLGVVDEVLCRVKVERVTRVDIALDYVGEAIADITPFVPRTTWRWWIEGDAKGSYRYGAPRALRLTRIYDKAAERRARGVDRWSVVDCLGERHTFAVDHDAVTRVEATARGDRAALDDDLFDRVTLIRRDGEVRVPNGDIVAWFALRGFAAEPWLLSEIGGATRRTRFRRMLLDPSVTEHVTPSPKAAWAASRPAVLSQLSSWLHIETGQFRPNVTAAETPPAEGPEDVPQSSHASGPGRQPLSPDPSAKVSDSVDTLDDLDYAAYMGSGEEKCRELGYAEETWGDGWRESDRMTDEEWKVATW